jgi:glycosyltransferase involved in cell wall biosynthesis
VGVKHALIFVDNLRLGGYQRLALDQAYFLSDCGFQVTVIIFSPRESWDFVSLEDSIIADKSIQFIALPYTRFSVISQMSSHLKNLSRPLIISHSLRATLNLRILKFFGRYEYTINTTIHQLPGLTDSVQKVKRFIYAQFTDQLFCFSEAVEQSWRTQFGDRLSAVLQRFSRQMEVLRNGVYLERLPSPPLNSIHFRNPQIVFLGRLAFWKGLNTLQDLASISGLSSFDFLFLIPNTYNEPFEALVESLGTRAVVVKGKTVSSYVPMRGDVHVYPANYGEAVQIVEGISLNCLEMGAMGIPSLITKGGLVTWPELSDSDLYVETSWEDLENVATLIYQVSQVSIREEDVKNVQSLVSIENQIEELRISFP